MAASRLQTKVLSSEKFVESCGAVLFDLSDLFEVKICLIQQKKLEGEWHLAKGRRNQGEARRDAAIREVMEETGFRCRLLPVTMPTRATATDAHADVKDRAVVCENIIEPFMCHIRTLKHGKGTKLIYWFIAVLEEDGDQGKLPGEDRYVSVFVPWHKALHTLTFQNDRDLVLKALELLKNTIPGLDSMRIGNSQQIPIIENTYNAIGKGKVISKAAEKNAANALKALKSKQRRASVITKNEAPKEKETEQNGHGDANNNVPKAPTKVPQKGSFRLMRKTKLQARAERRATKWEAIEARRAAREQTLSINLKAVPETEMHQGDTYVSQPGEEWGIQIDNQ